MMKCKGKIVFKGTAMGKILVLNKEGRRVTMKKIQDADMEISRVQDAVREGQEQLQELYEKALVEVGEANAAIFTVHQMMMEDEDYLDAIFNMIRTEAVNAEYAVFETGKIFAEMFAAMDDDYMKARSADVKDISERIVDILEGNYMTVTEDSDPVIVVAEDLSPSETVAMDKSKILAFVTVGGSTNSHTAILARMMSIPTLIGCEDMELSRLKSGMVAIVDGHDGVVIFNPTPAECVEAMNKIRSEDEKRALLETLKGKDNVTKSGRRINIYANIGGVNDCGYVLESDASGVGLFRSEFLYLGRDNFPDEEEQFTAYKQVAQALGERPVIIRTLDLGADKQVDYFNLGQEENPALGYRAIRICLSQTEIFKTQLRALLRAAVYGNIEIMYPMITSREEIISIKEIVREVEKELAEGGIEYRIPKQGIMIETPAAVMISDQLAEMVDFFSIGTNDLTQYTLAVDRQNNRLDRFYNPHHDAILRMIRIVIDNAHKAGIWAGICGELGADPELMETFIDMGLDEVSVSPSAVLKLRQIVREMD